MVEKTKCGLIAEIDEEYDGGFLPLYSPPEVDLTNVKHALIDVLNGSFYNFNTIDLAPINIGNVSKRYIDFLSDCAK